MNAILWVGKEWLFTKVEHIIEFICAEPNTQILGLVKHTLAERRSKYTVGYKKTNKLLQEGSHTQETSRSLSLFINLPPCSLKIREALQIR